MQWLKNNSVVIFLTLFILYLLPMLILGENTYITIHDNLDSDVAWRVVLARSALAFDFDAVIPQIMNGLPRTYLPNVFNIVQILFQVFEPFTAYLINHIFVHSIAFLGMYLLLTSHVTRHNEHHFIALATAFCFAILPFYTLHGLTIAGQPLLLWAFINIHKNIHKLSSYLIIGFFPFYSSFLGAGIFILALLSLWFLIDWQRTKHPNIKFLSALLLLTTTYLIIEFNLLFSILSGSNSTMLTHRVERVFTPETFAQSFNKTLLNFISGQYHAVSLQNFIITLAVPLALVSAFLQKKRIPLLTSLLFLSFAFSMLYGFMKWEGMTQVYEFIPILKSFNYTRFHWLHPLLWYLIFALSLSLILGNQHKNKSFRKYIVVALLTLQILFNLSENLEIIQSAEIFKNKLQGHRTSSRVSYKQFYSKELFNQIKDHIGRPIDSYRVVSIGMHPSIAQYNGFYTLDGYQYLYSLEYKHKFRRIIENELEKNTRWKKYFDDWGSRCYIMADEIDSFMLTKEIAKPIENLDLNTDALREIGGEYILSATLISNFKRNNLQFMNTFENSASPWKVYLYKVNAGL